MNETEKSRVQVLEHLNSVDANPGGLAQVSIESGKDEVQLNGVEGESSPFGEWIQNFLSEGWSAEDQQQIRRILERSELDPALMEVGVSRCWDRNQGKEVVVLRTTIDGLRILAERTGKYEGQSPILWCGKDGVWKDVWLSGDVPSATKVGVLRKGFERPMFAVARFMVLGVEMLAADRILAECAEAEALRRAFPQELAGIYIPAELTNQDGTGQKELPSLGISEGQLSVLKSKFRDCMPGMIPMLKKRFGVSVFEALSQAQARKILDKLQAAVAAAQAAMPKTPLTEKAPEAVENYDGPVTEADIPWD